jgi:hypothetical protein
LTAHSSIFNFGTPDIIALVMPPISSISSIILSASSAKSLKVNKPEKLKESFDTSRYMTGI